MKVDLLNTFAWEELNEALDKDLGSRLGTGGTHRIYQGLSQAVFEIVMGTALFYSHRKYYGLLSGETWAFDSIVPSLLKDGFQNQTIRAGQLEDVKAWVSGLSKETGFVMWSEDHPVLATYQAREELDQALNAQRIISVRVSHQSFLTKPQETRPYSVRICSLAPDLAVAVVGARFKSPPLFVHRQYWDSKFVLPRVHQALMLGREDQALVENFETQFDGSPEMGGLSKLPVTGPRIFDRALIFHPEISSEFIAQSVATAGKFEMQPPGFETQIEIVNRCRWQPAPGFNVWWDPKPRDAMLSGLLILSLEQIAKPNILKTLVESANSGELKFEPSP